MDLQNLLSNNKNNLPLSSASGLLGGSTNSFLSGNKQIPDSAGLGFLKSTQPILSPSPQLSGNKTLSALIAPQKNNMIKNTSTLKKVDPTISVAPVSNAKGIDQGQSFFGSVFNKMGQDVFKPEYQTPNIVSSQNSFKAPQFEVGGGELYEYNSDEGGSGLDNWGTNTNTNNTSTTNNMFGGSDTTMNTGSEFNTGNNQDLNKFDVDKYFQVIDTMNPTLEEMYQIRNAINNKRNDVAVGEVDPYELFTKRGITATPKMIENMRKSTAGIYDPLLSDINGKILAQERREELALKNTGTGSNYEFGNNYMLDTILSSNKFTKDQINNIQRMVDSGQDVRPTMLGILKSGMSTGFKDKLNDYEMIERSLGGLEKGLQEFYAAGGDTSLLKGTVDQVSRKLGEQSQKNVGGTAYIYTQLQEYISRYRQSLTGAAFSEVEAKEITGRLPSLKNSGDLNMEILRAQKDYADMQKKSIYDSALNIPGTYDMIMSGNFSGQSNSSGGLSQQDIQLLKNSGYTDEEISNYSGGFKSVGGGTNKAINNVNDAMQRIAKVESQGSRGYNAIGPVVKKGDYKGQKAVGKYQVMQGNIGPWTKEALGQTLTPTQFLNSPQAQDAVARYFLQKAYDKYGTWNDAASVWFTGQPASKAIARGANDGLSSVQQYLNKFNT